MSGFKVVDEKNVEDGAVYICLPAEIPAIFDNDIITDCAICGCKIRHRPAAPAKPTKICLPCAKPTMDEAIRKGDLNIAITPTQIKELSLLHAKTSSEPN